MNKIKTLLIASLALSALPLSAAQYKFVPANNTIETHLCIAAAENNLSKFKNKAMALSRSAGVYRVITRKLTCNDKSIADFAFTYDANKTVEFLDRFRKHDVQVRREISEHKKLRDAKDSGKERIVYVKVE